VRWRQRYAAQKLPRATQVVVETIPQAPLPTVGQHISPPQVAERRRYCQACNVLETAVDTSSLEQAAQLQLRAVTPVIEAVGWNRGIERLPVHTHLLFSLIVVLLLLLNMIQKVLCLPRHRTSNVTITMWCQNRDCSSWNESDVKLEMQTKAIMQQQIRDQYDASQVATHQEVECQRHVDHGTKKTPNARQLRLAGEASMMQADRDQYDASRVAAHWEVERQRHEEQGASK
jgi:hypothetical protein